MAVILKWKWTQALVNKMPSILEKENPELNFKDEPDLNRQMVQSTLHIHSAHLPHIRQPLWMILYKYPSPLDCFPTLPSFIAWTTTEILLCIYLFAYLLSHGRMWIPLELYFCLLCSLLNAQVLEQILAYGRCSVNVCWMNKLTSGWNIRP